ncbi:MAG: ATP-binding cassette domain-containing protein, partial [Coriobacteriales bacterium]
NALADAQALLPQDLRALFVCDTLRAELGEWGERCGYGADAVSAALGRVGLSNCPDRHPFDLSGGQQQLLGIAKLALTRPRLLLLDEPTKGLDASSRLQVARLLLDLARSGVTIVMATHDLAFAALVATSVTLLFDGQAACTEQACDFFTGNLFYRPAADGLVRRVLGEEGA